MVALPRGVIELRASGVFLPTQTAQHATHAAATMSLALAAGRVGACVPALQASEVVAIGACGGAELGATWASSRGVTDPGSTTALWAAAVLSGSVRAALTAFADVVLSLDAVAPVYRPEFAIGGLGTLHRASVVTGRAGLGFELELR